MKSVKLPASIYLGDKTWLDFSTKNEIFFFWEYHGHSHEFSITPKSLLELFKLAPDVLALTRMIIERMDSESYSEAPMKPKKKK
jgi:hypothetical protein